jgi:hypothetical protein
LDGLRKSARRHGEERGSTKQTEPADARHEGKLAYESHQLGKAGRSAAARHGNAADTSELPHLEKSSLGYVEMVSTLQGIAKERASLVASKQEAVEAIQDVAD